MNKLFEKDKRKRTVTILVIGAGISALVWVTLGLGDKDKKTDKVAPTVKVIKKEETLEEGFRSKFGQDLLTLQDSNSKMSKDVESLKTKAEQLESENEKLKAEVSIANSIMSGALKVPAPDGDEFSGGMSIPPAPSSTTGKPKSNNAGGGAYPDPNTMQPVVTVVTGLISVGQPIGGTKDDKPQEVRKDKKEDLNIPAGSFVKANLLSGVIAPTMGQGASDPVPVLLNVTGITQLPNFFKADIKNCFLLAETRGNLATETVSFRLKSLACKKSDGTTIEKAVDGYVTGENGVEGLQGRVVSKQGALIARSFAAEFLGGVAKAFEESGKTVSTTGSGLVTTFNPNTALQTGLFSGATGAFSRVSDFYMDLADNMVPVIEINAGRKVDVVFIKTVNFDSVEANK